MKGAPLVLALALAAFLLASNARAVGARALLQNGSMTYYPPGPAPSPASKNASQLDLDILNFALNLECLEAEFYLWAAYGHGLNATERGGGPASIGGQKANLSAEVVQYATEIANDEHSHVLLLRAALGAAAVPCPLIDVGPAFAAAANAATNATLAPAFNPYSGDAAFFLGAYVFEDVGVTAYHGALPLFTDKAILSVAGGLLGTEAYHAGAVRSYILDSFYDVKAYNVTIPAIANAISGLRNAVDGVGTYDQGPLFPNATTYNILPADANSLVFSRTPGSVIKIVTGGAANNGTGLFFPQGLNTAFTIKS